MGRQRVNSDGFCQNLTKSWTPPRESRNPSGNSNTKLSCLAILGGGPGGGGSQGGSRGGVGGRFLLFFCHFFDDFDDFLIFPISRPFLGGFSDPFRPISDLGGIR